MSEGDKKEKKTGVNITVSEKATDKIVDALVDTFSPLSQGLGAIGDRIQVYRQQALLKTLKRTKEIGEEEKRQIELPPPKFVVPVLEGASLEEDDDGLRDKWARLLANAGSKPSSAAYYARTVLSEISADEARLLDYLVNIYHVRDLRSFGALEDLINEDLMFRKPDLLDVARDARSSNLSSIKIPGVVLIRVNLTYRSDLPKRGYTSISSEMKTPEIPVSSRLILEGRNIIARRTHSPSDLEEYTNNFISVEYLAFTQIGFEVMKVLYGGAKEKSP